jgi:hypothetical protein
MNTTTIDFLDNLNTLFAAGQGSSETDTPSYTVIQHDINAIYEKIKEKTAFKSRALTADTQGFDKYVLSDDEKNIYRQFLKGAAEALMSQLSFLNKNLGKSMNFEDGPTAPLWLVGTTYGAGDIVSDGTYNYSSVSGSNTGHAVTDTTYWTKLTTTGIPAYVATQVYAEDDYVSYGGSIWKSLEDANSAHTPAEGQYWTECDPKADILNKVTYIFHNLQDFDTNVISAISDNVYQFYVAYVLRDWFEMNNLGTDFQLQDANVKGLLSKIDSLARYRIKPLHRTATVL